MTLRRLIIAINLCIFMSSNLTAQTYVNLWKQVENAQNKDLPTDQLSVLQQIEDKARKDKEYGHLLKAQLQAITVASDISPDSLAPRLQRYEEEATAVKDEALQAVYYTSLWHFYYYCYAALAVSEKESEKRAAVYHDKALANPARLAKVKAKTYEPLAVAGDNASIFNNDLLHLIAFETQAYQTMIDYYSHVGNRSAACIASLYKLRSERSLYEEPKRGKYIAMIDSLIHEYYDLDVAAELAIERLNVMETSPDISAEEKIEFIDDALIRWQNWPRTVVLRNARSRITLPSYNINIPQTLAIPDKEIPVYITSLKNLQSIFMTVYRVDITGSDYYDPKRSDDYRTIANKRSDKPVATDSRTYYGLPEYREVRDTLTIAPLPAGVYLVEFFTDNNSVATERLLLHITNLRVIDMSLPQDKMRLVAVDATTGKPLPHAKIYLKFREWRDRRWVDDETVLTTEKDGEVVYSSTLTPYEYRVATDDDKAFPWQSISRRTWNMGSNTAADKKRTVLQLYTDRALYRPAQAVQVSVIAYDTYSQEEWEVIDKQSIHLTLRDAKRNIIAEQEVLTDEWGVAAATFNLPNTTNTGSFTLTAKAGTANANHYFRVEEYKRPTFSIEIDDYQEPYTNGDTITVRAWAKTYSGVPVANAQVAYTVATALHHWWHFFIDKEEEEIADEETTTDSNGMFLMHVPIAFPEGTKKGSRFARITLHTQVSNLAGETHEATTTYPLSDKEMLFALAGCDEKQCREYPAPCSFVYLNNAGQTVAATATYTIDDQEPTTVSTNSDILLPLARLASGEHTIKAVCHNDTIEQKFIVFSINDSVAPVDTAAWYFSTPAQQRNHVMAAGKEEYIQFGTSKENQTVFYAIATDSTVIESGQLTLSNELRRRAFLYDEQWGNGIAIRYSWVRDGVLYSFSESLARPVKDCHMDVAFSSFRDRLTPGTTEEWTIHVTKGEEQTPTKAHLMAVLYDKSLDAIYPHNWALKHSPCYTAPIIYQTAAYDNDEETIYGEQTIRYLTEPALQFYRFDFPYLYPSRYDDLVTLITPTRALRKGSVFLSSSLDYDGEVGAIDAAKGSVPAKENGGTASESGTSIRQNLSETAFFMPHLTTDKEGNVSLRFTLPESVTTWRFLSVAHDKNMNVGSLQSEMIAQKNLMVQPNMPRFLRQGDKAQVAATIANISAADLTAIATITLCDPATEQEIFKTQKTCVVPAENTIAVVFDLPSDLAANVYTCVVAAQAGNVSDGEQHYLPVLSNDVEVVTTRAFTQLSSGEKTIPIAPLYGDNATGETLTVDYTDNPAWLLLESLPVIAMPAADDAISLAVALYANSLTAAILQQVPDSLFREKRLPLSADEILDKLRTLQNADGSFSWFAGMRPSSHVTHVVARQLVRMQHLGLPTDERMLSQALSYLDKVILPYVDYLKEREQETGTKPLPDDFAMDYLYLQALHAAPLDGTAKDNAAYLLSCVQDCSPALTIYGKANFAIIYACHPLAGDMALANTFLESVRQYSLATEEMGRYFDTPKARNYSWQNNIIPTQTAAIEAFQTVAPADGEIIAELQQWLLQEKRTQQWDTPINSSSAVYAFFHDPQDVAASRLHNTVTPAAIAPTQLYVDGVAVRDNSPLTGSGYFSATVAGRHKQVVAKKTSDTLSWGAVKVAYTQPLEDVAEDGEYLSVRREVVAADGDALPSAPAVGQRVIVRITLTSQRDLDFVEVVDNRPACLEPVNQLSGYLYGYYASPQDEKTVYYYDYLPKGKHTIETEYYVDRQGLYRAGLCTAKCTYAPEYQAREGSYTIEIK